MSERNKGERKKPGVIMMTMFSFLVDSADLMLIVQRMILIVIVVYPENSLLILA